MCDRAEPVIVERRVAVVGCGYWGRNLARAFADIGALAAVSDPDEQAMRSVSSCHGAISMSIDQVCRDTAIEAVAIAAPAALHHRLTLDALHAGKDVFVEKPLALSVREAQEAVETAASVDAVLMVGHLLQYHPAFVALAAHAQKGVLGRIQYVYSNRLNLGRFRQEEDILWSFAPHDISMILSLIGEEPDDVRAIGSYHLDSKIADVTTTHLSFPGGQKAHVYVSWLHPYKEQRLVVVGDEGMAVFDDSEPWDRKLLIYPHRVLWENGIPKPMKADAEAVPLERSEPLRNECEHFLACISSREAPRTDGAEGLRVLRVLERAARSMVEHSSG